MPVNIAEVRKAVVAMIGVVAMVVSLGLLHGTTLVVAQGIISIATALGVYATPNQTPKPTG